MMTRTTGLSLLCLLVGLAGGVWYAEQGDQWQAWPTVAAQKAAAAAPGAVASLPQPRPSAPLPTDLTSDEQRTINVYDTANRSVVNIDTTTVQVDRVFMMQREAEGSGSGVVLDREGHIITNYHVVDGARKIDV